MRHLGLTGAVRGKTPPHDRARPLGETSSRFGEEAIQVADFTYCSTWSGTVYTAFVIDVSPHRRLENGAHDDDRPSLRCPPDGYCIWARNERLEIWCITLTAGRSIPPFATPIDSSRPVRTVR
jgi:hypothetical protein